MKSLDEDSDLFLYGLIIFNYNRLERDRKEHKSHNIIPSSICNVRLQAFNSILSIRYVSLEIGCYDYTYAILPPFSNQYIQTGRDEEIKYLHDRGTRTGRRIRPRPADAQPAADPAVPRPRWTADSERYSPRCAGGTA